MLHTMSSSSAPSARARSASATFTAVVCPPSGKPTVVVTFVALSASSSAARAVK